MPPAKVVFVNGTSSSGKTTLSKTLQVALDEPFCYYASDQLADSGFRAKNQYLEKPTERERFFDGFHHSIPAFASRGNNLIVEHIIEEQTWAEELHQLLASFNVLWVGVHAPLDELCRREKERGDRFIGEAAFHLKTHQFCRYDVEIDSMIPLPQQVGQVKAAWKQKFGS